MDIQTTETETTPMTVTKDGKRITLSYLPLLPTLTNTLPIDLIKTFLERLNSSTTNNNLVQIYNTK